MIQTTSGGLCLKVLDALKGVVADQAQRSDPHKPPNLIAMASKPSSNRLQPRSDGLQPTSDGLRTYISLKGSNWEKFDHFPKLDHSYVTRFRGWSEIGCSDDRSDRSRSISLRSDHIVDASSMWSQHDR